MTIQRLENVGIVVDDLAAATEFFVELGLKLLGEGLLAEQLGSGNRPAAMSSGRVASLFW